MQTEGSGTSERKKGEKLFHASKTSKGELVDTTSTTGDNFDSQ